MEIMWWEAVLAYMKVISGHVSRGTYENHQRPKPRRWVYRLSL